MRRRLALALVSGLVVPAACACPPDGDGGAGDPGAPAGGGTSLADDDLRVHLDLGDGTPAQDWSLTCAGSAEGSHPSADAACGHLAGLVDPFAPLPDDIACTEQYGGPQTALVTGRWAGDHVELELSRTDGCRIAQWDRLGPLLPIPVGAEPTG